MGEKYAISEVIEDNELLDHCVALLHRGGLAIFPTDTVYGIGARADHPAGVDRIYELKKRSRSSPLPVLLGSPEDLDAYGCPNETARALAKKYWPGAVTIVVPVKGGLAPNLSETPAVGFRCPDHAGLRKLIRALKVPLAGTSANRSGEREVHSFHEVDEEMREACDLLLDGGILPGVRSSTVVDCTHKVPQILRRGDVDISVA
jgi:L-threonylcarbamoyladenylate synthase